MAPSMQMAQSIQTFNRESQAYEEPVQKQAVGVVMGDMGHPITVLGIVETLVFDFPTTLGHAK